MHPAEAVAAPRSHAYTAPWALSCHVLQKQRWMTGHGACCAAGGRPTRGAVKNRNGWGRPEVRGEGISIGPVRTFTPHAIRVPEGQHGVFPTLLDDLIAHGLDVAVEAQLDVVADQRPHVVALGGVEGEGKSRGASHARVSSGGPPKTTPHPTVSLVRATGACSKHVANDPSKKRQGGAAAPRKRTIPNGKLGSTYPPHGPLQAPLPSVSRSCHS
jgi:hypothetical protein